MDFIFTIFFVFFKDKSSYENCFACIFGISCMGSCFLPFLSLKVLKENIKLMAFCEIVYAICGAREFVVPAHFPLGPKARVEESSCRGQVSKVQMA